MSSQEEDSRQWGHVCQRSEGIFFVWLLWVHMVVGWRDRVTEEKLKDNNEKERKEEEKG